MITPERRKELEMQAAVALLQQAQKECRKQRNNKPDVVKICAAEEREAAEYYHLLRSERAPT